MRKSYIVVLSSLFFVACVGSQKISNFKGPSFDKQGHRGSRGLMPENTIPAMLKALELDVTTLELDVVISADKQVVVSHDPYFNYLITTTPEGKTLTKGEGEKRLLYQMPYDSIRKYDVGLKPHPDYPRQQKIAVAKPLLVDLLEETQAAAKGRARPVYYNIEVKSKPENDGKKHPPIEEFVTLVVEAIQKKGLTNQVTIQSFDPRALQVMHRKFPGFKTSYLMEATDKRTLDAQLQELGYVPQIYSPHFSLVTPELLAQCRQKGIQVIPWTVNNLDEMKRLKAMGVNGIITDYPDLFAQM